MTTQPTTKLEAYMQAQGLRDAALAQRIACDRSMVTKLRHGKAKPSLELALKIRRETGIEVEDLLPPPARAAA